MGTPGSLAFAGLASILVDTFSDGSSADEGIANPEEDLAESLRETIEDNPNDTVTMALLANVLANSGNLDEATTHRVLDVIDNIREHEDLTVLVATHDRELIKWVGRRTIHLEHGHVVQMPSEEGRAVQESV